MSLMKRMLAALVASSLLFFVSCSASADDSDDEKIVVSGDSNQPAASDEENGGSGESAAGGSEKTDDENASPGDETDTDSENKSGSDESGAQDSQKENQSSALKDSWWRESAFYHIWVKSFADSDGDGCGDLKGIESKLSYIQDTLGCDAIWLSPIFECKAKGKTESYNMHGYDTTDYYAVNSYFGTEADLTSLINACHDRNMKIIFDFVPNHTSTEHQWFKDSIAGANGKEDWYLWSDTDKHWTPMSSSSGWRYNSTKGKYYYGAFDTSMPDLNYNNTEVRAEMKNVVRYWLDKGFDGLRIDAARYLIEAESQWTDTAATHAWFQELRTEVLDSYESPKFMVCEAWVEGNRNTLNAYFGSDNEFNMVFDFDAGRPCITSAEDGVDSLNSTLCANPSSSRTYGVFLGNHDEYAGRLGTTLNQDWKKINLATALSLLRPTVPFIYYGNELGQPETSASGDIRLRGNYSWTMQKDELSDDTSPLAVNKVLLALRKANIATFADGSVTKLTAGTAGTLAYVLSGTDGDFLCVYNLSSDAVASATFSGSAVSAVSASSCVIGDTDAPALAFASSAVTVGNLAPCTFRVYALGTDDAQNIYDTETYEAGESYEGGASYVSHSEAMYVRGGMNGWGGTEMTGILTDDGYVWSVTIALSSRTYEFKFCTSDSSWPASGNWGSGTGSSLTLGGGNISYTAAADGSYTFFFNETALTCTVSAAQ